VIYDLTDECVREREREKEWRLIRLPPAAIHLRRGDSNAGISQAFPVIPPETPARVYVLTSTSRHSKDTLAIEEEACSLCGHKKPKNTLFAGSAEVKKRNYIYK
jgi:hypothetical protein